MVVQGGARVVEWTGKGGGGQSVGTVVSLVCSFYFMFNSLKSLLN